MSHEPPTENSTEAWSPPKKSRPGSLHPLYRTYIYIHIILTLCGAIGANLRYGLSRPESLQWIAGLFLVSAGLCVYIVPLIDAFAFLALTGRRLQLLPYLSFDLVLWYFQVASVLPEVQ